MNEKKYKILLVEDNPDDADLIIEFMQQGLAEYQYTFTIVDKLAAAMELLNTGSFDIVLLDLTLPDSSGIQTMLQVSQISPDVPIVILTGLADETLASNALKQGAQDYLIKDDIDGRQLAKAIRYSVERHRLLRELNESQKEREDLQLALKSQKQMRGWEQGSITATMAGLGPLREREPEGFDSLQSDYGKLLSQYLKALNYRDPLPRHEIDEIATKLGDLDAGPRDVVDLHLRVIERLSIVSGSQKARSYTIDGRLFTIEIMGMLVDYYRRQ